MRQPHKEIFLSLLVLTKLGILYLQPKSFIYKSGNHDISYTHRTPPLPTRNERRKVGEDLSLPILEAKGLSCVIDIL